MTAATQAKAVLDNLKGGTFTGARALKIAQDFINDDTLANEATAQLFLDEIRRIVRQTVRSHNRQKAKIANESAEIQAGEDAVTDL